MYKYKNTLPLDGKELDEGDDSEDTKDGSEEEQDSDDEELGDEDGEGSEGDDEKELALNSVDTVVPNENSNPITKAIRRTKKVN